MDNYNDFFNDPTHAPVVCLALAMGIARVPESHPHQIAFLGDQFTVYDRRDQKPLWSGNLNYSRDIAENDFGAVSAALRRYNQAASVYSQFRTEKYGKGKNEGIPRYSAWELEKERNEAKEKSGILVAAIREYLAQTDFALWIDAPPSNPRDRAPQTEQKIHSQNRQARRAHLQPDDISTPVRK